MNNEPKKYIDFIITQNCTYRCPYCSQSKCETNRRYNASDKTIYSFYNLLDNLDNDFEITITGGEAILHPKFYEILDVLKEKKFKTNLITNLSFKINTYLEIFKNYSENLNRYDISLHINQIQNFKLTLEKLEEFISNKPSSIKTTVFIPLYKVSKAEESKIDKILKLLAKYNVDYSFQKIRFVNSYKNDSKKTKYNSKHKIEKTFSKLCYAGNKSAIIYENGNAYRCYSSRFLKSNYLGNINDFNFKLNMDKSPCVNCVCCCPKPKNYNQITEDKNTKESLKMLGKNVIYFPILFIKNFEIVKNKISQYFKI